MDSTTPFQPWAPKDGSKTIKTEEDIADDAKLQRENVNHPKHTQTASHDKETIVSSIDSPGTSAGAELQAHAPATETAMDSEKISSMQHIVENTLSPTERQRVGQLLVAIDGLSGPERLLLYLRLPTGVPPHDPLKQPINPLGSRAELQQTITWIQTHLEVDPEVSLPKQDVYDEYIAFCMSSNMKPLSTADFGKVMKQVYPTVRPRRLGTRGNSRYCYAGLRKKIKLKVPQLPNLGECSRTIQEPDVPERSHGNERLVIDWAETKLGMKFNSISELSMYLHSSTSMVGPASISPPPLAELHPYAGGSEDDQSSRQLMKQLKRKIQTQSQPGRPKKTKPPTEVVPEAIPSGYLPDPPYLPYEPTYFTSPQYYEPFDVPMNLSSDSSLDLTAARPHLPPRKPPEPPPKLPLPGKKLILETYRADQERYLPKKMRAAESLGGKRPPLPPDPPEPAREDVAFLDDPKNATRRSTSTAAALVREELQAAGPDPERDTALHRERVISVCNMDKHALDDYLNEGSSQEHEEELLKYFHPDSDARIANAGFLEAGLDPHDRGGKSEKISQLRELLARNLKNQNGTASLGDTDVDTDGQFVEQAPLEGFKHVNGNAAPAQDGGPPPPGELGDGALPAQEAARFGAVMKFAPSYSVNGFVPISCPSPARAPSPAASPFVSPRATPAPRCRPRAPRPAAPRPAPPRPAPPRPARRRRAHVAMPAELTRYAGPEYCQPMSAPPSPNILCHRYKNQMQPCIGMNDRGPDLTLNFFPHTRFHEGMNGDRRQPLSADPLSSEVSQFFHESCVPYGPDVSFRSQSAPLKPGLPSYNSTPVSSVPPTPIPHEFSDFGPLAETCDISKACLNPESLDKIYDAIDSSNDVLSAGAELLEGAELRNGCGLAELSSLLPEGQYGFTEERGARSVPGTPLPLKSALVSKSVPGTPQLERVFGYTQRDFLINGNSLQPLDMLEPAELLADLDKIDPVYM